MVLAWRFRALRFGSYQILNGAWHETEATGRPSGSMWSSGHDILKGKLATVSDVSQGPGILSYQAATSYLCLGSDPESLGCLRLGSAFRPTA